MKHVIFTLDMKTSVTEFEVFKLYDNYSEIQVLTFYLGEVDKWAATCDFQQCGILTSVDSDESVQTSTKLRNSKWCPVSSLTLIEYIKPLAKALIRLRVCAGWSETLLVAHTTLLEVSCCGSNFFGADPIGTGIINGMRLSCVQDISWNSGSMLLNTILFCRYYRLNYVNI